MDAPPPTVDGFLLGALGDAQSRAFILRLERDFDAFVRDESRTLMQVPPMNSYNRRVAHRVAAHFGLAHFADPARGLTMDIAKVPGKTAIPLLKLQDYCAEENSEDQTTIIGSRAPIDTSTQDTGKTESTQDTGKPESTQDTGKVAHSHSQETEAASVIVAPPETIAVSTNTRVTPKSFAAAVASTAPTGVAGRNHPTVIPVAVSGSPAVAASVTPTSEPEAAATTTGIPSMTVSSSTSTRLSTSIPSSASTQSSTNIPSSTSTQLSTGIPSSTSTRLSTSIPSSATTHPSTNIAVVPKKIMLMRRQKEPELRQQKPTPLTDTVVPPSATCDEPPSSSEQTNETNAASLEEREAAYARARARIFESSMEHLDDHTKTVRADGVELSLVEERRRIATTAGHYGRPGDVTSGEMNFGYGNYAQYYGGMYNMDQAAGLQMPPHQLQYYYGPSGEIYYHSVPVALPVHTAGALPPTPRGLSTGDTFPTSYSTSRNGRPAHAPDGVSLGAHTVTDTMRKMNVSAAPFSVGARPPPSRSHHAPPAELSHILEVYDIHDSESADGIHAAIPHEVRVKHLSATSLLLIFPSAHAAKVHASEHATKQHQSGSLEAKYKLRTWRPHIQG